MALAFVVSACDLLGPDSPWDFLEYEATAAVDGDSIRYILVIRNPSNQDVAFEYKGCVTAASLSLYQATGDGHALRWDERRRLGDRQICMPKLWRFGIHAGGERPVHKVQAIPWILGDSLPGGSYRAAVSPWFTAGPEGPEVPAGEVVLSAPDD